MESSENENLEKRRVDPRYGVSTNGDKLMLVMVGLPARGKSFISKKLQNFLIWQGVKARVFNVGQFRRHCSGSSSSQDHNFFDSTNAEAKATRDNLAYQVADQALTWLWEEGDVAIFDATNSNRQRRRNLLDRCDSFAREKEYSLNLIFIESICDNEQVLLENVLQKVRDSPDYRNMDETDALSDLKQRIAHYEMCYESISGDDISYIKLFNLQSKVHANRIYGRVAKSLLPYMMSIHIGQRPIWFTRAGHCTEIGPSTRWMDKVPCVASRSASLSDYGRKFAERLAVFVKEQCLKWETRNSCSNTTCPLSVFTSTLPRSVETAQFIPVASKQYATLNPLDKGECYGLTVEEMASCMPEMYAAYEADPLNTRFPGGESYHDLMMRLEPILVDIEQQTGPVLVVSHISSLQVLYSYFVGVPIEKCHTLSIPFHSVLQLVPRQDGWTPVVFDFHEPNEL